MKNDSPLPELLNRALSPTPRGVIGAVDELLSLCPEQGLELTWHADKCQVRQLGPEPQESTTVPLQKSVFRAILARLAALCNERSPKSVSPYRGEGEFSVESKPPAVFRVAFANTPGEQRLEVRRKGEGAKQIEEGTDHSGVSSTLQSRSVNEKAGRTPLARVALLFPGQGAQSLGMGRDLCAALPQARQLFAEASELLGYDLLDVCVNGPVERLNSTAVSQPALFVASLAALESLKQSNPQVLDECVAAAGLSLGEFTALTFAGALTFAEGLRLVQRRGEAMQAAADRVPSGMVSVLLLEQAKVEDLCTAARQNEILQIANYLCPGNCAVSGHRSACDRLEPLVTQAGGRPVRLAVAGAFHTPLMKPAAEAMAEAFASVPLTAPRLPVWSNVTAQPHGRPDEIRVLLQRQIAEPVRWEETVRQLLAARCDRFYEVGPGRVLAGLLKRIQRKVDCYNVGV